MLNNSLMKYDKFVYLVEDAYKFLMDNSRKKSIDIYIQKTLDNTIIKKNLSKNHQVKKNAQRNRSNEIKIIR